jgi:hypothetical protein
VVDCGNHRIQKFEVNYIKDKLVELTKLWSSMIISLFCLFFITFYLIFIKE